MKAASTTMACKVPSLKLLSLTFPAVEEGMLFGCPTVYCLAAAAGNEW